MSGRLLSFPGQGSKVLLDRLQRWAANVSGFKDVSLIDRFTGTLEQPETIAACSNLLYSNWLTDNANQNSNGKTYVIGHSLGELNALNASVNGLAFGCKDIIEITSFRNRLMVEATQRYLEKCRITDDSFELWAVTNVRSKNLRKDLSAVLDSNITNSSVDKPCSIKLANDNAVNQCVITGLSNDIQKLVETCKMENLRHKFTKLDSPFSIPFHNINVLRSIQEPLYDFIWDTLKENGKHHFINEKVENGIFSNIDGKLTYQFDTALENFVAGSCNIVNFVDSCKNISSPSSVEKAYHFGPGTSIGKLIERNLKTCDISHNFID